MSGDQSPPDDVARRAKEHASKPLPGENEWQPEIKLRGPLTDTATLSDRNPPSDPSPIGATSETPAPTKSGLPSPQPRPGEIVTGDPPSPAGSSNPQAPASVDGSGGGIWTDRFGYGQKGFERKEGESDVDFQKRWNEERIERRLRGQYERAGKRLSDLVNESLDTPLRLNAIRFIGAKHTRASFLSKLSSPYLVPTPDAGPTQQSHALRHLLAASRSLTGLISQFDLFSEIEAGLERSPSLLSGREDVDLVFRVKEVPRYWLKSGGDIGNGEGSATGSGRLRNVFGGGESLTGDVSFGTRTKSSFQLAFETPVNASPTTKADFSVFGAERDFSSWASCREKVKGIQARLKTVSQYGYHELAYDATLRHIANLEPHASMSMRESAGQNVKSAISHSFIRDSRDDPFLASTGSYLRLSQEYAGLGGDTNHIKAEAEAIVARAIPHTPNWILSAGLRSGLLFPLFGKPSHFSDRFHMGGPTSIRMFNMNEIGPKDNGDWLGGDLKYEAGLSLVAPIPKKEHWPVKLHSFVNAGRLTGVDPSKPLSGSVSSLFQPPVLSAGLGLIYRHSVVRIEVNVGVPIAANRGDGVKRGLQVGLGINFL